MTKSGPKKTILKQSNSVLHARDIEVISLIAAAPQGVYRARRGFAEQLSAGCDSDPRAGLRWHCFSTWLGSIPRGCQLDGASPSGCRLLALSRSAQSCLVDM